MKTYEVQTAATAASMTMQVERIEAPSERAAYRQAAAQLAGTGGVIRSIVEIVDDLQRGDRPNGATR